MQPRGFSVVSAPLRGQSALRLGRLLPSGPIPVLTGLKQGPCLRRQHHGHLRAVRPVPLVCLAVLPVPLDGKTPGMLRFGSGCVVPWGVPEQVPTPSEPKSVQLENAAHRTTAGGREDKGPRGAPSTAPRTFSAPHKCHLPP